MISGKNLRNAIILIIVQIILLVACSHVFGFEASYGSLNSLNDLCERQESLWCEPLEGDVNEIPWREAFALYGRIKYQSDIKQYGVIDKWADMSSYDYLIGDCEDFALTWGALANEMGVDSSDITLVHVMTDEGAHIYVRILDWVFDSRQTGPSHTELGDITYTYRMGL